MCALRSSSMIFTENRNMLKPVKSTTKTIIHDDAKRNMLLRARKLSLDSDSFMKSLQGKYEQKEPKPPPIVGLGVRRYKGSKSALGRDIDIEVLSSADKNSLINGDNTGTSRKKSLANGHADSSLTNIQEEQPENGETVDVAFIDLSSPEFMKQEAEAQAEVDERLAEVDSELREVLTSLDKDDLDLQSSVKEPDDGASRAHEAASSGDIAALKRLLKEGYDLSSTDEDGVTALQLAVGAGHTLALRIMAANGGDVNVIDRLGRSLLHTAVLGGHNRMVAALLAAGSKGDSRDTRRGRTPLHVATLEGELVMIRMLVQALKDDPWGALPLLSITDKDGRTPLHVAAGRGFVEAARLLLSVGFSVTRKDLYGLTPMHAALGLNHANKRCRLMLRLLLEAGGDLAIKEEHPEDGEDFQSGRQTRGEDIEEVQRTAAIPEEEADLSSQRPEEGDQGGGIRKHSGAAVIFRRRTSDAWVNEGVEHVERMIHMAARVGCSGCLALLIEYGAPVNSRDRRDRTPLHLAAETNRSDAARTLVRLGATLDARDGRGLTPLHAAIAADSPASVGALLSLGADPHIRDEVGRSYAEHALFTRKLKAFKSLVKQGVSAVAEEGSTILHSSSALGCITSTQLLLEMGWVCDTPDRGGLTPLHAAIGQGHEDIATLLITEGVSIMKRDNKGATPLHYATRWGGSDALLRMLVKRGASLSAKDRLGRTPLHYAASKFSIMSDLYILLGGGADLNPADISGLTPLHLAARLGNESLVRILLEKGANPTMKDMYNFTPFDHAKENKHASIMKRLQDYMAAWVSKNGEEGVKEHCGGPMNGSTLDHPSLVNGVSEKQSLEDEKEKAGGQGGGPREGFKNRGHRVSVVW